MASVLDRDVAGLAGLVEGVDLEAFTGRGFQYAGARADFDCLVPLGASTAVAILLDQLVVVLVTERDDVFDEVVVCGLMVGRDFDLPVCGIDDQGRMGAAGERENKHGDDCDGGAIRHDLFLSFVEGVS